MLSRRLAIITGSVVAAFAIASLSPPPALGADVKTVYKKKCSPCHGKEGEPNKVFKKQGVRSFKDGEWQKATDDAAIEKSIREGKKGTMMASFEKQLSDEEVTALVAFIRDLGP